MCRTLSCELHNLISDFILLHFYNLTFTISINPIDVHQHITYTNTKMKISEFTTFNLPTQSLLNQVLDEKLAHIYVNFLVNIDHDVPSLCSIRIPTITKLVTKN